jgi:S-adenosylmethionine:tRNA ribosyltransferase-isomerase
VTATAALELERFAFELPSSLEATEPPEAHGLARDAVRMLVTCRGSGALVSSSFQLLPSILEAGDLVVINTSATIPAAIDATDDDGERLVIHLSSLLDDGRWIVEPRQLDRGVATRWRGSPPTSHLRLAGGATVRLDEPLGSVERLWIARLDVGQPVLDWLATHGRPIRYGYVSRRWPIGMYQNVYATEPGSAEMPSAGRPFTDAILTRLAATGIGVAPIVLHTGVASLEGDELPYPERLELAASTAERVNATRASGGRVIAVGTTVVRGLETAVGADGQVHAYDGWTDLVITPDHAMLAVDGMVTGWHEPVSSHLFMLEAMLGRELLLGSYDAALAMGYRWHEFGDSHLIVP